MKAIQQLHSRRQGAGFLFLFVLMLSLALMFGTGCANTTTPVRQVTLAEETLATTLHEANSARSAGLINDDTAEKLMPYFHQAGEFLDQAKIAAEAWAKTKDSNPDEAAKHAADVEFLRGQVFAALDAVAKLAPPVKVPKH
jgi:hypothetical protein